MFSITLLRSRMLKDWRRLAAVARGKAMLMTMCLELRKKLALGRLWNAWSRYNTAKARLALGGERTRRFLKSRCMQHWAQDYLTTDAERVQAYLKSPQAKRSSPEERLWRSAGRRVRHGIDFVGAAAPTGGGAVQLPRSMGEAESYPYES